MCAKSGRAVAPSAVCTSPRLVSRLRFRPCEASRQSAECPCPSRKIAQHAGTGSPRQARCLVDRMTCLYRATLARTQRHRTWFTATIMARLSQGDPPHGQRGGRSQSARESVRRRAARSVAECHRRQGTLRPFRTRVTAPGGCRARPSRGTDGPATGGRSRCSFAEPCAGAVRAAR